MYQGNGRPQKNLASSYLRSIDNQLKKSVNNPGKQGGAANNGP